MDDRDATERSLDVLRSLQRKLHANTTDVSLEDVTSKMDDRDATERSLDVLRSLHRF